MPFEITIQTIERTLADKVFALCDYYMEGKVERHSRHLYDIHKIVESIDILDEIIESQAYKKDYEDITMGLLFVPETYDAVIQSLKKLADSGLWD